MLMLRIRDHSGGTNDALWPVLVQPAAAKAARRSRCIAAPRTLETPPLRRFIRPAAFSGSEAPSLSSQISFYRSRPRATACSSRSRSRRRRRAAASCCRRARRSGQPRVRVAGARRQRLVFCRRGGGGGIGMRVQSKRSVCTSHGGSLLQQPASTTATPPLSPSFRLRPHPPTPSGLPRSPLPQLLTHLRRRRRRPRRRPPRRRQRQALLLEGGPDRALLQVWLHVPGRQARQR